MKYLVAVSGGVDSVVLLDKLVASGEHDLIVAHFDHGIREDSAADARFVQESAAKHKLPFVGKREELGKEASEEFARERRYTFLFAEAKKRGAFVVTAHHAGDVVETMAINLIRGTGWRGIAVMDNPDIIRPLLPYSKMQILQHALEKRLEWVEDNTNISDDYLRNRIRRRLAVYLTPDQTQVALELWREQVRLKREIDAEVSSLLESMQGNYSRYFFANIEPRVAMELLRAIAIRSTGSGLTRPQLERSLIAVKTARPRSKFPLGKAWLMFTKRTFSVSVKTP